MPPDLAWIESLVFEGPLIDLREAQERAATLAGELEREIRRGHPLWGKHLTVVAEAMPVDDVFVPADDECWVVHVTWREKREAAGFPWATRLESPDALELHVGSYGWVRGGDY